MAPVTKAQIVAGLRALGLKRGDILMVHSSLSSFGRVLGGAETVVDALLEVIGPEGTLLMPTLVSDSPYDFRKSPSNVGEITECFRKRPGVVRSLNPCVPAAAYGPRAVEFTANHHKCECPYIGSPYDLAAKAGGYVLLLGCDQDRNTTLHCAEALAGAPYLNSGEARYVDENDRVCTYRYLLGAGPHRDFIGIEPKLRQAGLIKYGKIGKCVVRLMKGQELIDFCVAELKKDPALFLTKNDGYYDGVFQRGKVRAARLSQETFKLVVRTGSAGKNLEEVLRQAVRAGASGLELDVLAGLDASGATPEKTPILTKSGYTEEEMRALLNAVERGGMSFPIVRCINQTWKGFQAALGAARLLKAQALICPLTGSPALLKARAKEAHAARIKLLLENVAISSEAAAELLKGLAPAAALAFNPANFAEVGEMPFLQAFRKVKKYVRYLAITDMYPFGVPCLPGAGVGEVKELISILRCSSFDGWFSLGCQPGANLAFGEITDAFYRLLDAC